MSTPEREQRFKDVLVKRQNTLTVLLENVEDPHNISAVLRTADSVGCTEIYVLNNRIPIHQKWGGFRSSSGANKWVPVHQFKNTESCIIRLRAHYSVILATHLSAQSRSLYTCDLTVPTVLAFGNEATGISEELLAHCDGNICIPQHGLSKSLNISVACAVILYEALRQKELAGHYDAQQLTTGQAEHLVEFWKSQDSRLGL
jgi:tRNA (guanosine-2'-O-)-methyltransferase